MRDNITVLEVLITHFKNYFTLNKIERNEIEKLFTGRTIKRRGFVLQQGDVCRHFTFIVEGCLKMYAVDQSGNVEDDVKVEIPNVRH